MIGKLGKEVKALKKILIVEDDQLLNRTLAYNLTSDDMRSFRFLILKCGKEAAGK